jgi:hypothetical protein
MQRNTAQLWYAEQAARSLELRQPRQSRPSHLVWTLTLALTTWEFEMEALLKVRSEPESLSCLSQSYTAPEEQYTVN